MGKNHSDQDDHSCDDDPTTEQIQSAKPYASACDHEYDPFHWWPKWLGRGRVNALSAALIAFFTVVLTIATYGQWKTANRSLKLLETAERPWIRIAGPTVIQRQIMGPGRVTPIQLTLTATNIGKSPARLIEFRVGTITIPARRSFPDPVIYTDFLKPKIVMFPGTEYPFSFADQSDPASSYETFVTIPPRSYVYAEAIYEDMRSGTIGTTTFCLYWNPITEDYRDYCDGEGRNDAT